MKLVIDCRKAFDSGIGTYIRNLVPRVIARLGPRVAVALLMPKGCQSRQGNFNTGSAGLIKVASPPLSLGEQFELRALLDQHTLFWATSLAHPLWCRTPMMATVHDAAQLAIGAEGGFGAGIRLASRVFFRSLGQRAGLLLMNSEFTQQEFHRLVGGRRGLATCVTPLGVGAEWFTPNLPALDAPATADGPYFVALGSVRRHKNLGLLIRAMSLVADKLPHRLYVVGRRGGFRSNDDTLDCELDALGSRVQFTEHLEDERVRTLVADAQALVFPSLYEGFGLPALEAMAAGCPVIASRIGALLEVCGDAATYFDPRNERELAEALLDHASMARERRQAILERASARARGFTWDHTAELTVAAMTAAWPELRGLGPQPAVPDTTGS